MDASSLASEPGRRSSCRIAGRGFTLIEMLVVLGILGIVVVAIWSLMVGPPSRLRLDRMTSDLVADLTQARDAAVLRGRNVVVVFDPDALRYSAQATGVSRQLPRGWHLTTHKPLPRDDRAQDRAGISFFADGSSSGGRIDLSDGTHERHVDIDWLTGRVAAD